LALFLLLEQQGSPKSRGCRVNQRNPFQSVYNRSGERLSATLENSAQSP